MKFRMKNSKKLERIDLLIEIEKKFNLYFLSEYKQFLLRYNGGSPFPNKFSFQISGKSFMGVVVNFFGINRSNYDLCEFIEIYQDRLPDGFIPIAYDSGGNLICLSTKGDDKGNIYFWDHENEVDEDEIPDYSNVYLLSNSLNDFILNLK